MYELPGLWFNASELHALLSVQQLLANLQPGLLDGHLGPLQERIDKLLAAHHSGSGEIPKRIRILQAAGRPAGPYFQPVAGATAQRRRLRLRYYHRGRDCSNQRDVSPQGLTHYRDTWYLDAWCHLREDLRPFALDAIEEAQVLDTPALDVPRERLLEHAGSAYGIFSGSPTAIAVLRFTPERARWVARERWHQKQEGRFLDDGHYELQVPYSNPSELIMDILKFGPDVEVMGPLALREKVGERLRQALARYDHLEPCSSGFSPD